MNINSSEGTRIELSESSDEVEEEEEEVVDVEWGYGRGPIGTVIGMEDQDVREVAARVVVGEEEREEEEVEDGSSSDEEVEADYSAYIRSIRSAMRV